MKFEVALCTQQEWAENTLSMYSAKQSIENYLRANIFSCLQFLPEDKNAIQPQAYCLKNSDGLAIAWMNVYFISKNVIRIRSLYVLPDYRRQGAMSQLLNTVLGFYRDKAKKVISFSRSQTVSFHEKNLFVLETNFVPRKIVLYDPSEQSYSYDADGEIVLMSRSL